MFSSHRIFPFLASLICRIPGTFSKKIFMIGNILLHDWRITPARLWYDFSPFRRYRSPDAVPDISDLDEKSQANIRRFLSLGMIGGVFDARYYFFNYSKLLPPLPRKERRILEQKKQFFCRRYDLPPEILDKSACCFSHGLNLLPDRITKYIEHKLVVDAGAYVGDSALSFLFCNPEKILSFEPDRQVFDMLRNNLARLPELRGKCEIFQLALGEKKGDLHFRGGLLSCCHEDASSASTVRQTTVDDFLAGNDTPVGLLKADVEGMGLKVLRGARETILRDRPVLTIAVYHCPEELFGIRETLKAWSVKYRCLYEFLEPEAGGELTMIACPEELDMLRDETPYTDNTGEKNEC